MEIQNVLGPVTELKEGKPEALTPIPAEAVKQQGGLENKLPENLEFSSVQIPENNDKAVLSGEADAVKTDEEQVVREIENLMKQLAAWKPTVYGDVEIGLEQLKEMYMLILKLVAKLPERKIQATLLDKLEVLMLKSLEGYAVKNFESLERLFRQYGGMEDRTTLLNSLFKVSVGRTLPPDTISKFLKAYSINTPESGAMRGEKAAVKESHIEGVLYQKHTSDPPELYRKAFSGRKLIEADYMNGLYPSTRKESVAAKHFLDKSAKSGCIFPMRDLKITEQFLKGLLGDGDLLRNTEIKAHNPQIKGFLAAATGAKAEMFLQTSGIQKGLISCLGQAIDRMVHTYIAAVSGKERPATLRELPKNSILRVDNKEMSVYNSYYQIRLLCQRDKNKGKALSSALRYAYTEFVKHEENEGSFFGYMGQRDNDCKKGFVILKENWKQFVSRLPISAQRKRELEESFLSPWGSYSSPLIPLYNPELGSPIIIGGAVVIGIIILVSMFI